MNPAVANIALAPAEFAAAFPFHFAFDRESRLVQFGSKFPTICPQARSGRAVDGLLRIIRPDLVTGWGQVSEHLQTLFLIECRETGINLRGQMLPLDNSETILFLGSPWFTDAKEVVAAGLAFDDFAIHDSGLDMLLALQAQKMGYEEIKALASQLSKQRAELRESNKELGLRNDALNAAKEALQRSSETLRTTARRLETLVRNLHEGLIVEDENRRIVLVNELFCQLFSIAAPPAALIGADCAEAARHAAGLFNERERFVRRIDEILRDRKAVLGEELSLVTGRVYERDYMPVMDGQVCIGHLWAYRDITPQKKAERELRAERNLLSITLSSMADGVITVDKHQRVQLMNSVAIELTGWRQGQAVGRDVQDVMVLETNFGESVPCPLAQSFFGRERVGDVHTLDGVMTLRSQLGARHTVVVSASPFFSAEGDVSGGIVIIRDVTTEAQVERMKRSFVDSVSHELKTPLTAIQGFVTNLHQEPDMDSSTRQEFLNIIREQTQRLASLVEDILDLSRIESGEGRFQDQPVHMEEIVRRSLNAVMQQAKAKGIVVSFSSPRVLPQVVADPARLESIVTNLLTNAVKFTTNGGLVTVLLECNGRELMLAVRDTGLGIPREFQTKIFRKFYRVEQPGSAVAGTGLGLSIVHGIVQHYGGRVEVESQEGEGSCFRVYLPLSQVSPDQSSRASSAL